MIKNFLFPLLGFVVVLLSSFGEKDDMLVYPDPVVENENEFVLVDLDGNRYLPFLRTDKTLHYQFTVSTRRSTPCSSCSLVVPLRPQ